MVADVFSLNEPGEMSVRALQIAGRCVAVVDKVYRDPDAVRRFALAQSFDAGGGIYPGRFARVPLPTGPTVELANRVLMTAGARSLTINDGYEGVVAFALPITAGADLTPLQQIPHADIFCDYAGVLYLSKPDDCSGGTSFWRHRRSGLEYSPVDGDARSAEQVDRYGVRSSAKLHSRMIHETLTELIGGYITHSNDNWELIEVVEMRTNRLVIYDANLFHSIYAPRTDWVPDPNRPRLTQNLYLNWAPSGSSTW